MKKFLLFALLFAASVMVLKCIEGDPTQGQEIIESNYPNPFEDDEDIATDVRIGINGKFEYTKEDPNNGKKVYFFKAMTKTLPGGVVKLDNISAVIFDPETGEETARVKAGRGSTSLHSEVEELTTNFDLELDDSIELEDVELELLGQTPIAPLFLRTPNLSGVMAEGRFWSDSPVIIDSATLRASGTGFDINASEGHIVLRAQASAELATEKGREVLLSCSGVLDMREDVQSEGGVTLQANDNAKLSVAGDDPLSLEGDRILIFGHRKDSTNSSTTRESLADERSLGFETVRAEGGVRLSSSNNLFLAELALLELGSQPGTFEATLSERPRGSVRLDQLPSEGLAGKPLELRFEGQGPLTLVQAATTSFQLPGPASLEWEETRLTAARMTGVLEEGRAEFQATDNVLVQRPDGSLTTDEFLLTHIRDDSDRGNLMAVAGGKSLLSGAADTDHHFQLWSDRRIAFEIFEDGWRLPQILGMRLLVDGPRGFEAKADEVSGFQWDPLRFEASSNVELLASDGKLRGEDLQVWTTEDLRIEGTQDDPVVFSSPEGTWKALWVERHGNLVVAEDVGEARFIQGQDEVVVSCKRLEARSIEEPTDQEGIVRKRVEFEALGGVVASAQLTGNELELKAEALKGQRSEYLRDGEFLWAETSLFAGQGVIAVLQRDDTAFQLTSRELDLYRVDRGAADLFSTRLQARGEVQIESLDGNQLSGTGDQLEIDRLGRGRLKADEGKRVVMQGSLPGSDYPFEMTADWITFSDTFLDASKPEIRFAVQQLDDLSFLPSALRTGAKASADLLECGSESLTFSGTVTVEGSDDFGQPWNLQATRVKIDGQPSEESARLGILDALRAWDGVVFKLGTQLLAHGDELRVEKSQRRLRIEGSPTRVQYQDFDLFCPWLEYDFQLRTLRTGKGSVRSSKAPKEQTE